MARTRTRSAPPDPVAKKPTAIIVENMLLDDVIPYDKNPRQNAPAIGAVKNSIVEFGFRIPVVIDGNRVLVAGHTRWAAMKLLREENPGDPRFETIPCMVAEDLTPDQLRAFRIVDNKTASLATWDFDLLSEEVSALVESGIQLSPFGWTREELDCLSSVVSADCLSSPDGINAAIEGGRSLATHRDGQSVRISIADLSFYVLREDYDVWLDELRRTHNQDLDAMLDALATAMGLLPAKRRRTEVLAQRAAAELEEHTTDPDDEE